MRFLSVVLATIALSAASTRGLAEEPRRAPPVLEFLYVEMSEVTPEEAGPVEKAVSGVDGVRSFAWTVAASEAKVVREVGKAGDGVLLAAAKGAGASAASVLPMATATLTFEKTLHCGGCVKNVTTALRALKGVKEVVVPGELATVWVAYDSRHVTVKALRDGLAKAGYPTQ